MSGLEKAATGDAIHLGWDLVQGGWRLLEALDDAGLEPDTAFWMWFRDVSDWRLMLSGGRLLEGGARAARRRVLETLAELPDAGGLVDGQIGIARQGARSVALIEGALQTGPGIHGIRISDNVVGGRRIRRAYVYRAM